MRPCHVIISMKAKKHLTTDNNNTLKSQITNIDQTKMKNLLCSSTSSCLNLHPTTQRRTLPHKSPNSFMELVNMSKLPWAWFHDSKVCFSWFALFPNLGFELLMVWIFFWDVNNLICYGFFCILVSWAVEKQWLHNKDSGMDGDPEANADLWTGFFHLCHHFCWFLLET